MAFRRGGAVAATLSAAALLVACSPAVARQAQEPQREYRVSGEYGLWVTEGEGELRVAWLTEGPAAGVLEVRRDGEVLHRFETPASQGHTATFARPGDGPLVLHYGARDGEEEAAAGGGVHTTTVHLSGRPEPPAVVLGGVDSLFAVGDVHGEYDTLFRLLANAGLVDADGRWTGGRKHLALLGDLLDRGDDVLRTLWFVYRLEREARDAGGGVHVILGNHETMVFTDDLRYVAAKEQLLATLHGTTYPRLLDIRHSVLGRWLSSRPALMKVDGALLAHGGVVPGYARYGIEELNDSLWTFMAEDFFYYLGSILDMSDSTAALVPDSAFVGLVEAENVVVMDSTSARRRLDFFRADTSVLWFRDYVDTDTLGAALQEVLERYDARLHAVGHTPVRSVEARYGGRLVAVDMARPATEMALLVRNPDGSYQVWRYGLEGEPERVEPVAGAAVGGGAPSSGPGPFLP